MRIRNRETSRYQTAVIVKPGKRALVTFLDILTSFILTLILFSICNLILGNMSVYTSSTDITISLQEELYVMVEDSGLGLRDDDGALLSQQERAENYVLSATLHTLSEEKDSSEISETIFEGVDPLGKDNDGLYSYNVVFKNENASDFTACDLYDEDSYYQRFTEAVEGYYESEDGLPVLTAEAADQINEYYISGLESGESIYDEIYDNYLSILSEDITEFTSFYTPYVEKEDAFLDATFDQLNMIGIAILFSYLLSLVILYIVLPLIFKDGRSLSMKVFSLAYCDIDGNTPSWINHLLRFIFTFISQMFIPFTVGLLVYGAEGAYFIQLNVMSFFNLFTAFIISIVYLIVSGIVSLIKRKGDRRQSLTDILSLLYMKNTKEYQSEEVIHFSHEK